MNGQRLSAYAGEAPPAWLSTYLQRCGVRTDGGALLGVLAADIGERGEPRSGFVKDRRRAFARHGSHPLQTECHLAHRHQLADALGTACGARIFAGDQLLNLLEGVARAILSE